MKKENKKSQLKSVSGMIIFFCISAFLWLVIKLSDEYIVQLKFDINITDQPSNQRIANDDYSIESTVNATGFKLLNYYFVPKKYRNIDLSLKNLKYKKIDDDIYSMNSIYIKESIANFMEISTNEVSISEMEFNFTMYRLASKKVRVFPQMKLSFENQYNYYGKPTVTPDSITINGAFNTIKDINYVNTELFTDKYVKENIKRKVNIQLDDDVYSDINEVEVNVNVEKYTESEVTVPINTLNISNLYLLQDKATVKYIVALNDYSNINSLSFDIEIDTTDFKNLDLLPLRLAVYPNNITIIGISPKEVEYLMKK